MSCGGLIETYGIQLSLGVNSYNFDYRPFSAVLENGHISLKKMVGAIGFEPTTPCAQGSFRLFRELPYFQLLAIQ